MATEADLVSIFHLKNNRLREVTSLVPGHIEKKLADNPGPQSTPAF